jgi:heterodisulfide reductase subunit C
MMASTLEIAPEAATSLIKEVMDRSEQNLIACYQCRRCAAACSVGDETGYITPDRLIRMILTGDRDNALNNELVWKCVSCYTCGIRCPNEIQTGRITETLKKMAKEEHLKPLYFKVANFHDSFVKSGLRWGRVNETEFMGFYEIKNTLTDLKRMNIGGIISEITTQLKLAMSMFKLKRMHVGFLFAKGRGEVKRLYKKHEKDRQ